MCALKNDWSHGRFKAANGRRPANKIAEERPVKIGGFRYAIAAAAGKRTNLSGNRTIRRSFPFFHQSFESFLRSPAPLDATFPNLPAFLRELGRIDVRQSQQPSVLLLFEFCAAQSVNQRIFASIRQSFLLNCRRLFPQFAYIHGRNVSKNGGCCTEGR